MGITLRQRPRLLPLAIAIVIAMSLVRVPVQADEAFTAVDRIEGTGRVEAAVAVAEAAFPNGAATVVLARVDDFPDALSGAPLAAMEAAPILFTAGDRLDSAVSAALKAFGTRRVIMLGGLQALSNNIESDLVSAGVETIERIAGEDRFETSRAIADRVLTETGARHAFLALGSHEESSRAWADAVAVSGLAAFQERPVLLTSQNALSPSAVDVLATLDAVTLVGGTAAISNSIEQQVAAIGLQVNRLAGPTRFHTSTAIAEYAETVGASAEQVWLATGATFADALASGPAVAAQGVVMLLADGHQWQSMPARDYLKSNKSKVKLVRLVGEQDSFPQDVAQDIEQLLNGSPVAGDTGSTAPTITRAAPPPTNTSPEPATGASSEPTQSQPINGVLIGVDERIQNVVDTNPPGTTFVIGAGVHREQSITPRSGDRFVGQSGAVLAGSKLLSSSDFSRDGSGRYFVDGQTQRTTTSGELGCTDWSTGNGHFAQCGHEQEVYRGEELFSNSLRLRHVNSLTELDSQGEWFFDYGLNRIWLFEDPSNLGLIETTTTSYAFNGEGTDAVHVENLVIRHYGSRAQRGALNGAGSTNWTVTGVDASFNHGTGIGIGPGMTIADSRVTYNGQLGMGGRGDEPVSLPVMVRESEIAFNAQLGFQHGWEAGGTKFTLTDGMVFEQNWVHNNAAKGLWFDIENRNAEIRYNVIENNGTVGIFWEISYAAKIHHNVVRNNHISGNMDRSFGNILVVSSPDVEVYANQVLGQGTHEIMGVHQDRGPGLTNFFVHDNDIVLDSTWGGGQVGVKDHTGTGRPYTTARYTGNRYYQSQDLHPKPVWWKDVGIELAEWSSDNGATVTSIDNAPTAQMTASTQDTYGPN